MDRSEPRWVALTLLAAQRALVVAIPLALLGGVALGVYGGDVFAGVTVGFGGVFLATIAYAGVRSVRLDDGDRPAEQRGGCGVMFIVLFALWFALPALSKGIAYLGPLSVVDFLEAGGDSVFQFSLMGFALPHLQRLIREELANRTAVAATILFSVVAVPGSFLYAYWTGFDPFYDTHDTLYGVFFGPGVTLTLGIMFLTRRPKDAVRSSSTVGTPAAPPHTP